MPDLPDKTITPITCATMAPAGGHYSHGMAAGDFVFVSGQLPINSNSADGGDVAFEAQVQIALDNVLSVVTAAGSTVEDVVRCTAYIVGVENWPEFNRVYAAKFGAHRPARTVVPVAALHFGYLVEIDAIAVRRTAHSTVS